MKHASSFLFKHDDRPVSKEHIPAKLGHLRHTSKALAPPHDVTDKVESGSEE